MPDPVVSLRGIRKSFGPVQVLHGVDFDVLPGEVHVLAGENGAGKSTLVNILSGVHTDFWGEMTLQGRRVRFSRPADAAHAGVATIHQELSLVPTLSVADNLFLGREKVSRWGRVDFAAQERDAARLLSEAGLGDVSPRQLVAELPLSTQQMLEIARALARDAALLILDEPTSALAEPEVESLFARIVALRAQGVGIVYISHKMDEIYRLADRITVLRDGDWVGTSEAADLPPDALVARLVGGRSLAEVGRRSGAEQRDATSGASGTRAPVLSVRSLRVPHGTIPGLYAVDGVSFDLRRGEVLGLAGLQGSGATEVLEAIFGAAAARARARGGSGSADTPDRGARTMELDGSPYAPHGPADALMRGVVFLTNDRKERGLALDQSVTHSVSLASLGRFAGTGGWMRRREEAVATAATTARLRLVAPSADAPVRALSGGNQQKVYLARCLLAEPRVLLLDEPTRGIDIGAKTDIYALVRALVAEGISIVLITSELDELLLLADRILVMHRGRVTAEMDGAGATKEGVLAAAMGHVEARGGA